MNDQFGSVKGRLASAAGAAAGMGGASSVVAVSICCAGPAIGPLLLSVLGIGPTVALEALHRYTIPMLAGSAVLIGLSFWSSARQKNCSGRLPAFFCAASRAMSWISAIVWASAVLVYVVWGSHV